jgi:hypothetical protein
VSVTALAPVTLPRPEPIACSAVLQMRCLTDAGEPLGVSDAKDDEGLAEADTSRADTSRDRRSRAPRIPIGWQIAPSESSG